GAAALDHFAVSTSTASPTAGSPLDLTAVAKDPFNNTITDHTGTTPSSRTNTDAAATLPGNATHDYTFVAGDNGSKTFTNGVTLTKTGPQTITATDQTASKSGSANVTVGAAALDHIVVSPDPATITAGGSQPYSAEGFDQFNNSRGDRTANTLLTISPTAGSSCEDVTHTCTSTVAADHTVTGTDAGAATTTDTATLNSEAPTPELHS